MTKPAELMTTDEAYVAFSAEWKLVHDSEDRRSPYLSQLAARMALSDTPPTVLRNGPPDATGMMRCLIEDALPVGFKQFAEGEGWRTTSTRIIEPLPGIFAEVSHKERISLPK